MSPTPKSKPDVTMQASQAVIALRTLSNTLPIDDVLPPKDVASALSTSRVPLQALQIVADILAANPAHYPQFDAEEASAAIVYEKQMRAVADDAAALAARITRSILKRRSANVVQALAVYGTLKSVARLPASEATRVQVKRLKTLLTTYESPAAEKVTQKELGAVAKAMKKTKVAHAKADEAASANAAAAEAASDAPSQVAYTR